VVPDRLSNNNWLKERGVSIWDEWAGPTATWARSTACNGAAGPRPTAATLTRSPRSSDPQDQPRLAPHHRERWNVAELDKMALMPCHAFFQFYVAPPPSPAARAG
jgi:thymidylate synthase